MQWMPVRYAVNAQNPAVGMDEPLYEYLLISRQTQLVSIGTGVVHPRMNVQRSSAKQLDWPLQVLPGSIFVMERAIISISSSQPSSSPSSDFNT